MPVSYTHLDVYKRQVYGGAGSGKMVMPSSSSPGVSLKQEGISYLAGAELPCLIVNVMRGGPGLGTIQPSQADYFQTVKGGGHGDYRLIALAPASVQEMADFVGLAFELAFKYRNPAIILADGVDVYKRQVGQRILAAAINSPISVMETAGEGGAWGIALLASYLANNGNGQSLADFLDKHVFTGNAGIEISPTAEDVSGFNTYIESYKAGLPIEEAAVRFKN